MCTSHAALPLTVAGCVVVVVVGVISAARRCFLVPRGRAAAAAAAAAAPRHRRPRRILGAVAGCRRAPVAPPARVAAGRRRDRGHGHAVAERQHRATARPATDAG